jgi:DNA repair photolyase
MIAVTITQVSIFLAGCTFGCICCLVTAMLAMRLFKGEIETELNVPDKLPAPEER